MRLFAIVLILSVTGALIFGGTNVSAREKENNKNESKVVLVRKGDTLTKIAKKTDTTFKRLFNANKNIKDPDLIYPGDKLRVPAKDEQLKSRFVANLLKANNSNKTYNYQVQNTSTGVKYSAYSSSGDIYKGGGAWDKLAACESGGNWSTNTGNGYYGGLQFTQGSWSASGGSGSPASASKAEQIKRAKILQSKQGWGAWPACSSKLGLR